MAGSIIEIERMLCSNNVNQAYETLQELLRREPDNAQAWCLLGGLFRRNRMWSDAIAAYSRAKLIDPDGPADSAIESIYEVLRNSDAERFL